MMNYLPDCPCCRNPVSDLSDTDDLMNDTFVIACTVCGLEARGSKDDPNWVDDAVESLGTCG